MAELPSSEALLLRSMKRTHEMYLSNYGQRPAEHEPSQKLRAAIKTKGEYALVKDMPAPAAGKPTAAGVAVAAATPATSAPKSTATAPLLLEQKGAKPAAAAGAKPSSAVVMHSTRGDSTHIIPRRKLQRDQPKPEWHAPWKLMRVISGHLGWVRAMAVDPTNQWFVTGSADRTIKVWDLASGNLKLTLTGHISCIRGLAISSRSPYMFSAGEDKMVKCWDLEYNKVIRDYHGHLSGVYSLSLHPTLDLLVTGGRDSVARVWDVRTKACVHTLCGHTQTVGAVATQALEPQIITGSYDATVRLWDLVAGRAAAVLTNHKKSVRAIALSPSEYTFATASTENIKKWKCPEGKFLHNMTGHNCIINSLCVNQDGVMASGGDSGSINMWDWKTGHNFQTLQTIAQPGSLDGERGIYSSMFDLSGSRLITGEADKTIKIWKEDADATEETHPVNFIPSSDRKRY